MVGLIRQKVLNVVFCTFATQGPITLVAARPSIGKTTFMLNLFLNLIDLNPDKAFYFFSYEESKSRLGVKLIQNLSGEVISQEFNHNAYIRYFKVKRPEGQLNPTIEEGFNKYSDLVKSGRLWLLDKSLNDADLGRSVVLVRNRTLRLKSLRGVDFRNQIF